MKNSAVGLAAPSCFSREAQSCPGGGEVGVLLLQNRVFSERKKKNVGLAEIFHIFFREIQVKCFALGWFDLWWHVSYFKLTLNIPIWIRQKTTELHSQSFAVYQSVGLVALSYGLPDGLRLPAPPRDNVPVPS